MSRIPEAPALRPISGRTPMSQWRPGPTPTYGEALGKFSGLFEGIADKGLKKQVVTAETDLLILKNAQRSAYDQDEDYGTISDRYGTAMEEGISGIADTIQDGRLREAFMERGRAEVALGTTAMDKLAWGKERDFERADLDSRLDQLNQTRLDDDDGLSAAVQSGERLIASAREMGYYTAQEGEARTKDFRDTLSLARLEMMPPASRLSALSEPWAKALPPLARAKMRRQAAEGAQRGRAMYVADDILSKGLAEREALEAVKNIRDSKERDAVRQRVKGEYADRRRVRTQEQNSAAEEGWNILSDGGKLDDVPVPLLDAMEPRARIALEQATRKDPAKIITDVATWAALSEKASTTPRDEFLSDVLASRNRLTVSDSKALLKANAGEGDIKDATTFSQQLKTYTGRLNKLNGNTFQYSAQIAVNEAQKVAGKELTFEERRPILDRLLLDGESGGFWSFDDMPYYKAFGTEKEAGFLFDDAGVNAQVKMEGIVPVDFRVQIIASLERAGRDVTPYSVLSLYRAYLYRAYLEKGKEK